MVSRVCVCIFFFCTYTGDRSVAQLTPAVLYVAEFFSFSINPPTKIRKGRNLCASKWVYFFPFILFFSRHRKRETHFPFSLRFAVECRGAMMAAQHLQRWINDWKTWWCRSIKSYTIPAWWMIIPTEKKKEKWIFSSLSPLPFGVARILRHLSRHAVPYTRENNRNVGKYIIK